MPAGSDGSGSTKADTGPLAQVKVEGSDPAKEPTVTVAPKPLKAHRRDQARHHRG